MGLVQDIRLQALEQLILILKLNIFIRTHCCTLLSSVLVARLKQNGIIINIFLVFNVICLLK